MVRKKPAKTATEKREVVEVSLSPPFATHCPVVRLPHRCPMLKLGQCRRTPATPSDEGSHEPGTSAVLLQTGCTALTSGSLSGPPFTQATPVTLMKETPRTSLMAWYPFCNGVTAFQGER